MQATLSHPALMSGAASQAHGVEHAHPLPKQQARRPISAHALSVLAAEALNAVARMQALPAAVPPPGAALESACNTGAVDRPWAPYPSYQVKRTLQLGRVACKVRAVAGGASGAEGTPPVGEMLAATQGAMAASLTRVYLATPGP